MMVMALGGSEIVFIRVADSVHHSRRTYSTACVLELRYLRSHLLRPRPTYFPSAGLLILLKKKSVEVMHAHELSVHSLHDLIGIFH